MLQGRGFVRQIGDLLPLALAPCLLIRSILTTKLTSLARSSAQNIGFSGFILGNVPPMRGPHLLSRSRQRRYSAEHSGGEGGFLVCDISLKLRGRGGCFYGGPREIPERAEWSGGRSIILYYSRLEHSVRLRSNAGFAITLALITIHFLSSFIFFLVHTPT